MNFTPEMIAAAKTADSPAALMAIARDHGITLSDSEAVLCFRQLAPATGELTDDELDAVSGGCGGGGSSEPDPAYETPRGFFRDGCTVDNYNRLCCVFPNSGCTSGARFNSTVPFRGTMHFTSHTQWYVTCHVCGKDVVYGDSHPNDSYLFVLAR